MIKPIEYFNKNYSVGSGLFMTAGASLVLALFLFGWIDLRSGELKRACAAPFYLSDHLFVLNGEAPELLIIDALGDRLCDTIDLETIPDRMLMAKKVNQIVLSDSASRQVWLVDPAQRRIAHRLTLAIEPSLLALSPDGESMVVADWGEGIVEFYALPTGQKTGEIKGLIGAHDFRFDDKGENLYISLADHPEIVVIDTSRKTIIKRIRLAEKQGIDHMSRTPDGRLGIAVPPPTSRHRIHLIDLEKSELIAPLELENPPYRAFSSLYGRYIFLPNSWGGEMDILSVSQRKIIKRLDFRAPITNMVPGFLGTTAYALSFDAKTVWGIDIETLEIIDEIKLPGDPAGMAVHEETGKLYIPISERNVVVVIDTRVAQEDMVKYREIKLAGKMPLTITGTNSLSFCH